MGLTFSARGIARDDGTYVHVDDVVTIVNEVANMNEACERFDAAAAIRDLAADIAAFTMADRRR